MAKTKIEWSDVVWNPVTGCSKVSTGCKNCYAERIAKRFWGERPFTWVHCHPERLEQPLHWRKPCRIFINSMGDLFHEDVPLEFIAKVFNVMACTTLECNKHHEHEDKCWTGKSHTFQVLTKRPERMRNILTKELPDYVGRYFSGDSPLSMAMSVCWPLPNVLLGVSVEDQKTADERIFLLLQVPAAMRFVSCEPLLGPIDLERINLGIQQTNGYGPRRIEWDSLTGWEAQFKADSEPSCDRFKRKCSRSMPNRRLNWVIVGGETGPSARPCHPDWVRNIRDQCQMAGVPFFLKRISNSRELDGRTWNEMPEARGIDDEI